MPVATVAGLVTLALLTLAGVRLLGIGVRFVDLREESNPAQLELFESDAVLT